MLDSNRNTKRQGVEVTTFAARVNAIVYAAHVAIAVSEHMDIADRVESVRNVVDGARHDIIAVERKARKSTQSTRASDALYIALESAFEAFDNMTRTVA